jgi:hypothetical protein
MFDDLDDPNPPVVPYGARDAVVARGARLRRRRRVAWTAGSTSLAVVLVASMVLARHEPEARLATEPTPSPSTEAPTESPTPSPTPSESPTPAPTATASKAATPSPTPSPEDNRFPGMIPDGMPGWGTGFTWCGNATSVPSPGGAPFPGLTLNIDLPDSASHAADTTGAATFHNDGDRDVRFFVSGRVIAVASDGHGHFSAVEGNDGIPSYEVVVPAGGDAMLDLSLPTHSCADTPDEEAPRLPPGTYTVGLSVSWSSPQHDASPSPSSSTGPLEPSPTSSPSPSWSPEPASGSGEWGAIRTTITIT